ncbi:Manganese transport protein MntH [hydrothermal vent metagenome]|jgi:NRAMP (natural resistance-associated macrophage protein)-like metal ion transporter|uniref:Manganese transport protein MntH n=1 Tax=hydrothermal vent metagenome TaxID=652676 RepID=A0A160TN48_9ZZZZ
MRDETRLHVTMNDPTPMPLSLSPDIGRLIKDRSMKPEGNKPGLIKQLGPGLITGAADDDPSGIATYSQAGAQFGFGLLWTLVLTYPLMTAVQLVSARIGRVTDAGLASNMVKIMPRWIVTGLVLMLFVANTINIGADLAAMGAAAQLVLGVGDHVFTAIFAIVSLLLQVFVPYHRYAGILKWMTLVLLAYVALVFMVKVDWAAVGWGMVWPTVAGTTAITTVVAIFGTTISPYLFFWQSSQEVEEVDRDDAKHALNDAPGEARGEFSRINFDTFSGMAVSNVVALAIMIGTAATLHAAGKTDIATAADAASALKPVAGQFAFLLFSLGIIGTGLLAIPVLAGSTAYAIGEARGWKTGLENKLFEARGFYAVIAVSTLLGIGIDWSPIDPIKALFWSAVINGVVAVPIMAVMMIVVSRRSTMGDYTASLRLRFFGWAATAVMGAAAVAMVVM